MGNQASLRSSPLAIRCLSRVWGPYAGAGIRVTKVAPDFREVETRMKLRWYNKNLVGTHYGGSLFSMTDPLYMIMLVANIGDKHLVWDKKTTIEFVRPGKTEVRAHFKLTQDLIEQIVEEAKDGAPHFVDFKVDVLDAEDKVVAKVDKSLYVRRKPRER